MVSVTRLLRLVAEISAALLTISDASSPTQQWSPSTSPKVKLSSGATLMGKIQTSVTGQAVNAFLGIPYTDAPVGDKRWKQSTLKTLTKDLNATAYGSICYGNPASDAVSGQFPPSEDCLFLNVFSPANVTAKAKKLPVMVWVHGGGFAAGAGNPYDATNLVGASRNNVIVVNFNYRLGALGFLSNDEILAQGQGANFGLRDQEVAFQWVKRNIASFGGDPDDITAFAESAGAKSLSLHLLSRDANQQLFRRAILQSGAYPTAASTPSAALQATTTAKIAASVGCGNIQGSVLTCLRKANASAITTVSNTLSWVPTVDKVFLLDEPIRRVLAGKISRIPTIMGTNTDDGYLFGSDADLATWIRSANTQMTESEYARVLELYPAASFATNKHRSGEVFNDYNFACPSELLSDVLATSSAPVSSYRYRFNYTSTEYGYPLVVHAKDLDFVFNRVANLPADDGTKQVVRDFQTFWTNYAISGSPSRPASARGSWPEYNVATKHQLVLQPELGLETSGLHPSQHAERCAFWHAVDLRIASSS